MTLTTASAAWSRAEYPDGQEARRHPGKFARAEERQRVRRQLEDCRLAPDVYNCRHARPPMASAAPKAGPSILMSMSTAAIQGDGLRRCASACAGVSAVSATPSRSAGNSDACGSGRGEYTATV